MLKNRRKIAYDTFILHKQGNKCAFLINKLKPTFNIKKAANKWRIEFNRLMLIIKLKPALINTMQQKKCAKQR